MIERRTNPWEGVVAPPEAARAVKPRRRGLTMVIDKGLGPGETRDLLVLCAPFIDYIKLGFGTSLLYGEELLREKIAEIRRHGVDVYPGGTLLEIAGLKGAEEAFLERAAALGFTAVEVSEGSVDLPRSKRRRLIAAAAAAGLRVLSEVGKKDRSVRMDPDEVVRQVEDDLEWGAEVVIVEGRDSGRGVGVYDDAGAPRGELLERILAGVSQPDRLMWEAPIVAQQQFWLSRLGPDVNLGNVQTEDVMTLEATRQALRGDTLRAYVHRLAAAGPRDA